MGGQSGQSVDIMDGEVIELADGKRYTVKYEDDGSKISTSQLDDDKRWAGWP